MSNKSFLSYLLFLIICFLFEARDGGPLHIYSASPSPAQCLQPRTSLIITIPFFSHLPWYVIFPQYGHSHIVWASGKPLSFPIHFPLISPLLFPPASPFQSEVLWGGVLPLVLRGVETPQTLCLPRTGSATVRKASWFFWFPVFLNTIISQDSKDVK